MGMTRKDFLVVARGIRDSNLPHSERVQVAEAVGASIRDVYSAPFGLSEEIFLAVATSDPKVASRQREVAQVHSMVVEQ